MRGTIAILVWSVLSGCAGLPPAPEIRRGDAALPCENFFSRVNEAVASADVGDVQAARVAGFPYLRADRLLASFRGEVPAETSYTAWVDRLQGLAESGYRYELSNLAPTERNGLRNFVPAGMNGSDLNSVIRGCGDLLRSLDLNESQRREVLKSLVRVPDDYIDWQRVVGVYPLTALTFAWGIDRWHEKTRRIFSQDLAALPPMGQLLRYAPPTRPLLNTEQVAEILRHSSRNPLHIPEPEPADLERLFDTFAPHFEIDTVTADDRIGAPYWSASVQPAIDIARPTVYRHPSHTRYRGQTLLQLNYIIWFPARPRNSALDLLGGHIDGITWRVTLTPEGRPWVYDSMHNCGCYHLFFPTGRAVPREQAATLEETAFSPQRAPDRYSPVGLVLRLAHSTHHLQRILENPTQTEQGIYYQWADYDELRSLPTPLGTRSLFRSDGMVPGSERLERYLFWPMGIPNPGTMRQWGHHATAFVGRRHFDDPDILERYFELRP